MSDAPPAEVTVVTTVAPGRRSRAWIPAALLAYHHVGYPALLWAWEHAARRGTPSGPAAPAAGSATSPGLRSYFGVAPAPAPQVLPRVAIVIAAHNESQVIAGKIASTIALDYPRELMRIVVAADGCDDDTVAVARQAGADLILELPRGGKMAAQHAAVLAIDEPIVAFSDANSTWEPSALRELVDAIGADEPAPNSPWALPDAVSRPGAVGYACGHVRFVREDASTADQGGPGATATAEPSAPVADNQEGVYWRYEMAIRARESQLGSVTAGNGAIYAIRRAAYADYAFDPVMGHDLAMPFQLVRAGWRAVDVSSANATEKMVPTIDGEFRRKRRMMSHAWPIVLRAGMLDLRGQPPGYALMLVSHRWLRYSQPLIHGWLAVSSVRGARHSKLARVLVAGQVVLLAAAANPNATPKGPVRTFARLARYYVATNAAIALGLKDHLVDGTEASWTPPEGTR